MPIPCGNSFNSPEIVRGSRDWNVRWINCSFALAAGLSGPLLLILSCHCGSGRNCGGFYCYGTGGYLAAKSDAEHYVSERAQEQLEVREIPQC